MLCQRYDRACLEAHLLPLEEWRPFPRAREREAWEALLKYRLNRERAAYLVGRAEVLAGQPWPALPASIFAEFTRNGNRSRYEASYMQRRSRLGVLALAESMEHQGRFLDTLMDGLLHVLEEYTWLLPAHAPRRQGDVLKREDRAHLALFNCETACILAEILYLLQSELQELSATLVQRLRRAILERVVEPAEQGLENYSWSDGHNNWTPWCCSSILGAAMHTLEDTARLARLISDHLNPCIDRYLQKYPDDGCCDEGPNYWQVSAGALLLYLEYLHGRTGGAVSIYDEPLLARMGEYIVDAHLDGPWFANFADSPARVHDLRRGVVYRFGERVGSRRMQQLVLAQMRQWREDGAVCPRPWGNTRVMDLLRELFWLPADPPAGAVPLSESAWYPRTQVLFTRTTTTPGRGLVLAAKGGHNGENHNHNDVGQFILLKHGHPFIVDPGVGVYSRATFDKDRYGLWYMNSGGHNLPAINGREQAAGRDFCARAVEFARRQDGCRLRLELSGAYPPETGVASCRRTLVLNARGLLLEDAAIGEEVEMRLRLYTPAVVEPAPGGNGLRLVQGGCALRLEWKAGTFEDVQCRERVLADRYLAAAWGERLTCIVLTARGRGKDCRYRLHMR